MEGALLSPQHSMLLANAPGFAQPSVGLLEISLVGCDQALDLRTGILCDI